MAAPNRLMNPISTALWAAGCVTLLFIIAIITSILTKNERDARIQKAEMDSLIHSHWRDIERVDYRTMADHISARPFYLAVHGEEGLFSLGERSANPRCLTTQYRFLTRTGEISISYCRPHQLPWMQISIITLCYILAGTFVFWRVQGSIGTFRSVFASLAHDIRSPAAALSVALDEAQFTDDSKANLAKRALDRLLSISRDPLRSKSRLGFSPIAELKGLIPQKQLEWNSPEICLLLETEVDEKTVVLGNREDFQRVVSNLLNNSREAMNRGTIKIEVERREELEIRIHDVGKGIAKEHMPLLFQLGRSFEKSGGSGLGLYHARRVIESWGGAIDLISNAGIGTTVRMRLGYA